MRNHDEILVIDRTDVKGSYLLHELLQTFGDSHYQYAMLTGPTFYISLFVISFHNHMNIHKESHT